MRLDLDVLRHHLCIFGVDAHISAPNELVCSAPVSSVRIRLIHDRSQDGECTLVDGRVFHAVAGGDATWARLRSLHPAVSIAGDIHPVVTDADGRPVWACANDGEGPIMLIGTNLANDLIRFRQGNAAAVAKKPTGATWGIAGERPLYLFEEQLEPDRPHDRMADWWVWTLRDALVRYGNVTVRDILPFGAPGAVVLTGDDDQAYLHDYEAQAQKLGRLPITYFLHPLTRHDAKTILMHAKGRSVEWELHPDALETPNMYEQRLSEQSGWFEKLTSRRARLVRNHGYLNDGYWGHAASWLKEGIKGSSNLPGVDGRVLNGSLLPARLALDGRLTDHWSQLTAFGDGVFFIFDWDDATAINAVMNAGRGIIDSGVPGILVLNLHPANHVKAAAMHEAAHRLVKDLGFAAMNFGDTIRWFSELDEGREPFPNSCMISPFTETRQRGRGRGAFQGIGHFAFRTLRQAVNLVTANR